MEKVEVELDSASMISLIYETAEHVELWPKLLETCSQDLQKHLELYDDGKTMSSTEEELNIHVQRALRMNLRIDQMQSEIGTTKNLLDSLPMAVITVSEDARVENLNRLARKVVSESQFLSLHNNTVVADNQANTKKLLDIIAFALGKEKPQSQQRTLKLGTGKNSVSIFAVETANKLEGDGATLCTLFVVTNFLLDDSLVTQLYDMYQLTPAEAKVALMLTSGDSLTQIADNNGVSQNTVRNQLKSIFAKTNTKRQPELVSLIWSTPTVVADKNLLSTGVHKSISIDDEQYKSLELRDGRALRYFEVGDPLGKPVLYVHEIVVWDWWNLVGLDNIGRLGIKLIVPCRPGFSGSSADPHVSIESWAKDVDELLTHLDLQRFYLLGHSSGGPYAAGIAHFLKEKCIALSLVSSMAPIIHLSDIKFVKPPMSRLLMGFAKNTPRIYRTFFNTVLKTAFANSLDYIQMYVQNWSEYDRKLATQKNVLDSITRCFRQAVKSDPFGLINESIVLTKPWGFELQELAVPTYIWRGEDDRAVPQNLAEKLFSIPGHQARTIPRGGHLIIYYHWQGIIESMIRQHHSVSKTGVFPAVSVSETDKLSLTI
ncbi:alpha/beta fold hydrolase [Agarilytica rhodophyticola]|uniref:alpha/beta fold hydrolase n=1 Tax=Agarilytica rhodophyticola TaxID=1737490 RepID=UPI000B3498DF|nr:alpha/beta fold hydrolase [Agarilytica rhodophyticola]